MPELLVLSAMAMALSLALLNAWGPLVHLRLAERIWDHPDGSPGSILDEAALLSADPARLEVRRHHSQASLQRSPRRGDPLRDAFLYGAVAADLINLKRFGGVKNSCHNWNMRTRLRRTPGDEATEVFIAGYLCHLAADVIAHNVYVPYHVLRFSRTVTVGHLSWELRADNVLPPPSAALIERLRSDPRNRTFDQLLLRVIRRRALPYRVNRRIFDHVLLARRFREWQVLLERSALPTVVSDASPNLLACLAASEVLARRVLQPGGVETLLRFDPTGRKALRGLTRYRRERLRGLRRALARARCLRELAEKRFSLAPFLNGQATSAAVAAQRRSA
ncbi:MAG: zinc dependent phospholipase C family protein [Planctomycetota bacterium]